MEKKLIDSIFDTSLSIIRNPKELELIKSKNRDIDPYYLASGCIKERREKFDKMWKVFAPHADANFLLEVKKKFHQRTWEMYMGCVLIEKGRFSISHRDYGPDFCINEGLTSELFIEATACERGISVDAVPEMFSAEKIEDIRVEDVPEEEMLLRLASALKDKSEKYKDFINNIQKPYIIAINRGGLQHLDPQIPLVIKCLFGIGFEHYKKVEEKLIYNGWTRREFIQKKNGEKIPMLFFEDGDNDFVSAIIYCPDVVLRSPEDIGSDCMVIHNPKAKFPLNDKTFSFLDQYRAEYSENTLTIKKI